MEGVRGFAALLVFCVHYANLFRDYADSAWLTRTLAASFEIVGHAGVDIFFVLSAYLLYGIALRPGASAFRFIPRRLQRIYPPFLAVLFLYIAAFALVPSLAKWPAEGRGAYLLQNLLLLPGIFDLTPVFAVAWSLSYELFFYLTLPLLAALLRPLSSNRRCLLILACSFGYCLLSMVLFAWRMDPLPLAPFQHARLLLFSAGMLARESRLLLKPASRRRDALVASAFVLALLLQIPLANPLHQQPWPMILRAILLGAACYTLSHALYREPGPLAIWFSWRPLRALGNVSYSFYLIHSVAVQAVSRFAHTLIPPGPWGGPHFVILFPAALAAAVLLTLPLYRWVEAPFSLRRLSADRPPTAG
jgi:peptidoglycan/LPS O-acetylase OafA/YrhL